MMPRPASCRAELVRQSVSLLIRLKIRMTSRAAQRPSGAACPDDVTASLMAIVRNTVRSASARIGEATFTLTTRPTPKQQQALDLLATIAM